MNYAFILVLILVRVFQIMSIILEHYYILSYIVVPALIENTAVFLPPLRVLY